MQTLRITPDDYDLIIEQVYLGEGGGVLTRSGAFVPITNYFDVTGEECAPADAVAAVAGPVPGRDLWLAVALYEMQPVTPQDNH